MGIGQSAEVDLSRFRGTWYDLAGINNASYAYSRITITATNSITFEEYDAKHILRASYTGTVWLKEDEKLEMTVQMPNTTYSNIYNVLYVDYDNFALLESEDGTIARILSRRPTIRKVELSTLRSQAELVGWAWNMIDADRVVLRDGA